MTLAPKSRCAFVAEAAETDGPTRPCLTSNYTAVASRLRNSHLGEVSSNLQAQEEQEN